MEGRAGTQRARRRGLESLAVRTGSGEVRVRFGCRRVLAAIEAWQPTVPVIVIVVADEGEGDAAQIERLVSQYAENQHRTGLLTP
jgi:ParB family chromosome partitioning protein